MVFYISDKLNESISIKLRSINNNLLKKNEIRIQTLKLQ